MLLQTRLPCARHTLLCLASMATAWAAVYDGTVKAPCGAWRGMRSDRTGASYPIWAFRGIQYAKPPTGIRRFQPPEAIDCASKRDTAVVDAFKCGDVCVQQNVQAAIVPLLHFLILLHLVLAMCFALCWGCLRSHGFRQAPCVQSYEPLNDEGGPPRSQRIKALVIGSESSSSLHLCCLLTALLLATVCILFAAAVLIHTSINAKEYANIIGSEDCLTLNVYAPERAILGTEKLPVLFFIHGGSAIAGTGCDYGTSSGGYALGYGSSSSLPETGEFISVTINYRLSAFGFLYMEDSSGKPLFPGSANLGVLDCIEALRWTRENIAAFGGDPDRVTVYGQSSGGTQVLTLLASPGAKGLFQRAYSTSGSASVWATKREASDSWRRFLVPNLDCSKLENNDVGLAKCIQDYPSYRLFSAQTPEGIDPPWVFGVPTTLEFPPVVPLQIVDGEVIIANISVAVAKGDERLPSVPTLIGATREESDLVFDPNVLWPLTREALTKWSRSVVGTKPLDDRLWKLFSPTSTMPARQRWGQLASDIRMVCPNLLFAQQVASAPDRSPDAPVYAALMTHIPDLDFRSFGIPISSLGMKYAFHMWDIPFLFFRRDAGIIPAGRFWSNTPLEYTFSTRDKEVADRYRAAVFEFASKGQISGWSPVVPGTARTHLCEIGSTGTVCTLKSETSEQCRLLSEYGLSPLLSAIN